MKNFTDSDYALNKYSDGIVYKFSDKIVEVTRADFLTSNPDKTEKYFRKLKEISDSINLEQVRKKNAQTKRHTSFDELKNSANNFMPSPETIVIDVREEIEKKNIHIQFAKLAFGKLTDVQRRRYILHHVRGLSSYAIAKMEGTNHKTVYESLVLAEKKIKKILAE
ncbi:hypothetical protein FACS189499_06150 [Clostridia bacterium]|nr:hypothetical protein FACS189499_06150 [Clostridia bacterium]